MIETIRQLTGDFVVLDLGSANSRGIFRQIPDLTRAITLIEIDALGAGNESSQRFHRKITLAKALAGSPGRRVFKRRKFSEGSSFLDPDPALLQAYDLGSYFETAGDIELECAPITEILSSHEVSRVDFFKTDLEGLDFEIIASAPELIQQSLCVQCELRFQPFYQGEATFHIVVDHLMRSDFELVWIQPEVWKYATPNRDLVRDGRLVWADALFFKKPEDLLKAGGVSPWKRMTKQIILAKLNGLNNYAEYLLGLFAGAIPPVIQAELRALVQPRFRFSYRLARHLSHLPGGWIFLGGLRRLFYQGYKLTALFKDPVIGTLDQR